MPVKNRGRRVCIEASHSGDTSRFLQPAKVVLGAGTSNRASAEQTVWYTPITATMWPAGLVTANPKALETSGSHKTIVDNRHVAGDVLRRIAIRFYALICINSFLESDPKLFVTQLPRKTLVDTALT
jgi:hypothetical protein